MLELLNAAACAVIFGYCFLASSRMPSRGMWANRLVIWVVTVALGLQMMGPWADWLPRPSWPSVLLHVGMAVALVVWRHEALAFVRCKFAVPDEGAPVLRRRGTDWMELSDEQAAKVAGGKK